MKRHRAIHIGIVAFLGAAHLAWAHPTGEPLKLTITTPEALIRESNLSLQVSMTNRTSQSMALIKSNPGCDFSAEVKDANGRPVALTAAGVELSHCENRLVLGRWIQVTLKPGESTEETYPIDLYYRLARPGTYTVQLTREVLSQPKRLIRSNEVVLNLAD